MGADRAPHWTARLHGYEAMTILADGRVLSTPGFPRAAEVATTNGADAAAAAGHDAPARSGGDANR
jgi:hypothetical protein